MADQLARGLFANFGPTEHPFDAPNDMEDNLRLIDDLIGLHTLAPPVAPGTALPVSPPAGSGQIFADGSFASFNLGSWKTYPARKGISALSADGAGAWLNTGAGWLPMRLDAVADTAASASAAWSAANLSSAAQASAEAAVAASGVVRFFPTKAAADAAAADVASDAYVEILADESQSGQRTRYQKSSGVLQFRLALTPGWQRGVAYTAYMSLVQWLNYFEFGIFEFMTASERADVLAKTYTLSVAGAIERATNVANGRKIRFPDGGYYVDRQLAITVWRYSWIGERPSKGCNAIGFDPAYAGANIRYRPASAATPMVSRSSVGGSSIIGPFNHESLTFDPAANNLFKFGDETLGAVSDFGGEAYVFGLRFHQVAIHCAAWGSHNDTTKVISRTGQRVLWATKCFEWEMSGLSISGGDTQIRAFGCDRPNIHHLRLQGGFSPVEFVASGTFQVLHTLENIEFEGWGGTAVRSVGTDTHAANLSFENTYANYAATGLGRHTLVETATVTAGSGNLVFTGDMTGKLLPGISIIEVTNGADVEKCLVSSVAGANVGVDTSAFAFTWSAAGCTVVRIHGVCAMHSGGFGLRVTGASGAGAPNAPTYAWVPSSGFVAVTSHIAVPGAFQNGKSAVLGNKLSGEAAMQGWMSFTGCAPSVVAEPGHPLVITDQALGENHGSEWTSQQARASRGGLSEADGNVTRKWVWTPKRRGYSSANGQNAVPFKRVTGDADSAAAYWAWYLAAGSSFTLVDETIPSVVAGGLRLRLRLKGAGATSFSIVATGSGGVALFSNIPVVTGMQTVDLPMGDVPAVWLGARVNLAGLQITANGGPLYVVGVSLTDEPVGDHSFAKGLSAVTHQVGRAAVTVGTLTRLFSVPYSQMAAFEGYSGKVSLQVSGSGGSGTVAFSSVFADYALQWSTFGSAINLMTTPVALLSKAKASVNSGQADTDVVLTAAVVSGVLEVYATVSSAGSLPATSALVYWDAKLSGPRVLRLING